MYSYKWYKKCGEVDMLYLINLAEIRVELVSDNMK